jgi:hypothetical protein
MGCFPLSPAVEQVTEEEKTVWVKFIQQSVVTPPQVAVDY